jgi:O-antigen/teichoic acid export membrane protein
MLAGVLATIALAAAGVAAIAGADAVGLLVMLALALTAWQLQEFVRRVFFTEVRAVAVCVNDVISYGGQLVGIMVLWRAGELTPVTALAVIAVSSALGAITGAWLLRSRFVRTQVATYIKENWIFGRWLLGSTLAMWTSSQLYAFLAALIVNVAASGALRAMQTVMGPTHILLRALDTAFTPTAARAYDDGGTRAVSSFVGSMYWATAPLMGAYCLLVGIFAHPIVDALYGGRYNSYAWLLSMLCVSYALVYLYTPIWVALRGMQLSAPMFKAYVASSVVVLTLGIAMVYAVGVMGAGLGLIIHGLILNAFLWKSYRAAIGTHTTESANDPPASRRAVELLGVDP